jgi:WhiB family redox-sensing transcriptional regulator
MSASGLTKTNYTPVIHPVSVFNRTRAGGRGGSCVSDRGTIAELALLPLSDVEELAWQEQALCAQTDPEAFFPEKGGSTREAKRVCLSCDVRNDCLEYALANDERFGIWGGLSERERRRLKKRAV